MEHEPSSSGGFSPTTYTMTLLKAVELGEYDPEVLSQWPEWHKLSQHARFQLVRKGLKNKDFQLRSEWAEINNQLNFSQKPYLARALKEVEKQITKLREEEDRMYTMFT